MRDALGNAATYAELLAFGEQERVEIVSGDLVAAPAALPRHSRAQGALRRWVGGPFDDEDGLGGPGGWWILLEVDIRLGAHDIVRPDLAGWRRERLIDPWDVRPIEIVPDWICEVTSPSNPAYDRDEVVRIPPFEAVELKLDRFFPPRADATRPAADPLP